MGTLTIRIPDDKHAHLKTLANSRGISLNKLFEEFSTHAIAESDAYARFEAYAAQGDSKKGFEVARQARWALFEIGQSGRKGEHFIR